MRNHMNMHAVRAVRSALCRVAMVLLILAASGCIAGPRSSPIPRVSGGKIAVLPVSKADLSGRVAWAPLSAVAADALGHITRGSKQLIGPEQFSRDLQKAGYGGWLAEYLNTADPAYAALLFPQISHGAAAAGYNTLLRVRLTAAENQSSGADLMMIAFIGKGTVDATVSEYRAGEAVPTRDTKGKGKYSYFSGLLLWVMPFGFGDGAAFATDTAIHQAVTSLYIPQAPAQAVTSLPLETH